ncbi:MAG: hypothetical protein II837_09850 [Treponema sp.]|nr:hypothetical protein [Treponema sp.]
MTDDDLKKQIDEKQGGEGFIKVTDLPVGNLSAQQRVILNRKANELFNAGKVEMAERIFITTGYSDGLTRCGDKYAEKNEYIKALRLYLLAHNKRKSEPLIEKVAAMVSTMLGES